MNWIMHFFIVMVTLFLLGNVGLFLIANYETLGILVFIIMILVLMKAINTFTKV